MYFNNVKIKGVGSYLPKKIITNHNIAENADTTDEWIYKSLGIKERRSVETETVNNKLRTYLQMNNSITIA